MLLEDQRRTAIVPGSIISLTPEVVIIPLPAFITARISLRCAARQRPTLLCGSTKHCTIVSLVCGHLTGSNTQVSIHTHSLGGL